MFRLIYKNKVVGVSKLESGDPSIGCVSGELFDAGDCASLAEWMLSEGGVHEEGIALLMLDSRFLVLVGENTPVPFADGSLICVPEENEMYLELVGIPRPEYMHFFPAHIASFAEDDLTDDELGKQT